MRILLVLFYLAIVVDLSAQITNVRKWRKSEVDSLDHALALYDDERFEQACPLFEGILKNHPKEEFIKYSYARCALYRSDKHEEAYLILTELYPKYNDIHELKFDIALGALYNLRFDEADEYLSKFMTSKRVSLTEKRKADALQKNVDYARIFTANPTTAKIENLGSAINSADDEYVPTITSDDSMLVFTYNGERSVGGRQNEYMQPDPKGYYMEDLYYSIKKNGEFENAKTLDSLNTNLPDAAISLSNDGRYLFLYQDLDDGHGDIYYSEYTGENYSRPKKLKGLNSYSWDGHCSLSPDGKTLYFSSERVGGFGGRDLYRAELLADSTWGNISNLGDSINTRFDEDAPFIHADGKSFFFSSKGRTSMGGYDIFRNTLLEDGTFGYSENLGCPINSTDDDIYFVLVADGKTGYYSSGRKGGYGLKDIYKVEPKFTNPVGALELVKGTVRDSSGAIETLISVKNALSGSELFTTHSIPGSGNFLFALPVGAKYSISFSANAKTTKEMIVDVTNSNRFHESLVNVNLSSALPLAAVIANEENNKIPEPAIAAAPSKSMQTLSPSTVASSTVDSKPETVSSQSTSVSALPVVVASPAVAVKKPVVVKPKDDFIPRTKYQEKTMMYVEKYGDIKTEGLEFKVQFAALKSGKKYAYPELAKIGKVESLPSTDAYERLTIGGSCKTLSSAFETNKKVVKVGHTEAFVIPFYKGKRTTFEELEKQNVFVIKN